LPLNFRGVNQFSCIVTGRVHNRPPHPLPITRKGIRGWWRAIVWQYEILVAGRIRCAAVIDVFAFDPADYKPIYDRV
jgi:hypothetical protein